MTATPLLVWISGPRGDSDGSVWQTTRGSGRELGSTARNAWDNAVRAFFLHAPRIGWMPSIEPPQVRPLGDTRGITEIDGQSFGLAFLTHLASYSLGRPPRPGLAATATITADANGVVHFGRVGGLVEKAMAWLAHAVNDPILLVSNDQPDSDLERVRAMGVSVQPVSSVAEALEFAFGADEAPPPDALRSHWIQVVLEHQRRPPFWEALTRTLTYHRARTPDDWRLAFSEAVLRRHTSNGGVLPAWAAEALADFPRDTRTEIMAHYVQHAHDTGAPTSEAVRSMASSFLPADPTDDHAAHRRLRGALARLDALDGRPEDSLEASLKLASAWLFSRHPDEASYPLCQALRLSGALGRSDHYDRAIALLDRYDAEARGASGRQFLAAAAAAGARWLGRWFDVEDHAEGLAPTSILRHQAAAARAHGQDEEVALAAFDRAIGLALLPDVRQALLQQRILTELDILLERTASNSALVRVMDQLEALAPAIVRRLRAGQSDREDGARIARLFPY